MPELPDVVVYCDALRARIVGEPLRGARIVNPFVLRTAVPPLAVPNDEERRAARERLALPVDASLVVYPGDLELGDGAARAIDAVRAMRTGAVLAMACRAKTARAKDAERELRARASPLGDRVRWLG